LIYATEKSLADLGGKVDGPTRMEVDDAVGNLKRTVNGEDAAEIQRLTEVLNGISHRLAQSAYAQEPPVGGSGTAGHRGTSPQDDDVVDAEYREVA